MKKDLKQKKDERSLKVPLGKGLSFNKKTVVSLFFVIFLMTSSSVDFAEYQFPKPVGYVNDFANALGEYGSAINYVAIDVDKNTSAEIAVVTISSINESGLDVNEYAVQLFQKWGIGKKEKDNGILVLLVLDSRRIKVEVGYGLEGILPDGKVGRILDNNLEYFKNNSFGEGMLGVVNDISDVVKAEYGGEKNAANTFLLIADYFPMIFFMLFFVLMAVAGILSREKCPKCKATMQAISQDVPGGIVSSPYITYTCPKCGNKIKKKRKSYFIVAGGFGGGHGGGFGGGMSGGGGAGRGF